MDRLRPTRRAMDDAMIAAVAADQVEDITIPKAGGEVKLTYDQGAPFGLREIFVRHVPTGRPTGPRRDLHVHAWFGPSGEVTYWRQDGIARVQVMEEMIPDTLAAAAPGRPIGDVVPLPGVGGWLIDSVTHNVIDGQHTFTLVPPAGA